MEMTAIILRKKGLKKYTIITLCLFHVARLSSKKRLFLTSLANSLKAVTLYFFPNVISDSSISPPKNIMIIRQ